MVKALDFNGPNSIGPEILFIHSDNGLEAEESNPLEVGAQVVHSRLSYCYDSAAGGSNERAPGDAAETTTARKYVSR